ncbi:MAG: hypothetical protein M3R45_16825 [Pseudomonadota bacterium]|nr:hypothetical protein [Pseudomonadota bacterium]
MKKIATIAACLFIISSAHGETFQMNCYGSGMKNVKVTLHGINAAGLGQASSELVQYDINQPGSKSALFVNENNDGVCKVKISSGYRMLNGHGNIDPINIHSSSNSSPRNIVQSTSIISAIVPPVCTKQSVNTLICSVKVNNFHQDLLGTVNVNWLFEYEKAN